ncbi:hypothetical protein ACFLRH_01820 [Actinomycetota bacterium]
MPEATHALSLRFDLRQPKQPNYPVVTILIDGEDILGRLGGGDGFIGFDPEKILDSGALVPAAQRRRVAVYRCFCGEAGCGVVAPVIEQIGDRVRWSDFRDFTGEYHGPLLHPSPSGGEPHPLTDLEFDADQYRREVERAATDRSWETAARQTARHLGEILARNDQRLTEQGYWRGWVGPHPDEEGKFQVEFVGPRGQVVIALVVSSGTPEEQAAEVADAILSTAPDGWNVEISHDWPPDLVRKAIAHRRESRKPRS